MKHLLLFFIFIGHGLSQDEPTNSFLERIKGINAKKTQTKESFAAEFNPILNDIKNLSKKERRELYSLTVKDFDTSAEELFVNSDQWSLIGAILLHAKDEKLIYDILKETPPEMVGWVHHRDFLETIPPRVMAKVIKDGAYERSQMRKKISALQKTLSAKQEPKNK